MASLCWSTYPDIYVYSYWSNFVVVAVLCFRLTYQLLFLTFFLLLLAFSQRVHLCGDGMPKTFGSCAYLLSNLLGPLFYLGFLDFLLNGSKGLGAGLINFLASFDSLLLDLIEHIASIEWAMGFDGFAELGSSLQIRCHGWQSSTKLLLELNLTHLIPRFDSTRLPSSAVFICIPTRAYRNLTKTISFCSFLQFSKTSPQPLWSYPAPDI